MLNKGEHIKTSNIPMFPLGIVILPGETRFLHIFEKRYKNLFEDLEKFDNRFGIPFVSTGRLPGTGSYVKLEKVLAKYPNGEADIAVKGLDIFAIVEYFEEHPERMYPYANIELLNRETIGATASLITAFEKYNEKVLKLDLSKFPGLSFYIIANSIGLSDLEKYDLLVRRNDEALNRALTNHLNLRTLLALQQNSLQEYYCLN
jgi:Lon protease-like protein